VFFSRDPPQSQPTPLNWIFYFGFWALLLAYVIYQWWAGSLTDANWKSRELAALEVPLNSNDVNPDIAAEEGKVKDLHSDSARDLELAGGKHVKPMDNITEHVHPGKDDTM
jgi:hypothetical protein